MFLAEVDISKTAYFMMTQNFSQVVTKFIPCDDVTRFDGTSPNCLPLLCSLKKTLCNLTFFLFFKELGSEGRIQNLDPEGHCKRLQYGSGYETLLL